jgi:hypothetical protein
MNADKHGLKANLYIQRIIAKFDVNPKPSLEKPGKISNPKHQIPNKSQIPIFNDLTDVAMPYYNLHGSTPTPSFDIRYSLFIIVRESASPKSLPDQTGRSSGQRLG